MTDLDLLVARLRDYSPENLQHVVHEAADAIEALRADAMRYRWLADRYFGADFRWGDPVDSIPVLVFKLDADCRVYGSCDMTVDAAMAAPPVAGPTEPAT